MKLSEVIKAIEDGKIEKAKSGLIYFERVGNYVTFYYNGMSLFSIGINQQFEEIKPPRQWSEKELMLFKLLPDWAKWIATDKDGQIWYFETKPTNESGDFYSFKGITEELTNFNFLTITHEESPVYIGDMKGE